MIEPRASEDCGCGGNTRRVASRLRGVFATLGILASAVGCGSGSTDQGGPLTGEGCVQCHGTEDNPAPPQSVEGETDTAAVEVGAHQSHLRDGDLRHRIPCGECHRVPVDHNDTDHIDDLPAEVIFGNLALVNDAPASWDRASEGCGDVYCHGATLSGGTNTTPSWTVVDGTEAQCGTCHGMPPPSPHSASNDCFKCHNETVDENNDINLLGAKHLDGILQFIPGSQPEIFCTTCHGTPEVNPAPPLSVGGETETTIVQVGAHQSHLRDGAIRAAIPCHECHLVPTAPEDPGHVDAPPAEVIFGTLSTTGGVSGDWIRNAETCSDAYCHGVTLNGGTNTTPSWTVVDGTQAACGTCHGVPPELPHPPTSNCVNCHDETINPDGSIDIAGGKHIDGILQASPMNCASCHGSIDSIAPPVATTGETDKSYVGVGAHQTHLNEGTLSLAFACDECHVVPGGIWVPGHIDPFPAELTWGTLATADSAVPTWDQGTTVCTNYCHGETLGGGVNKTPVWTEAFGEAACGACHGLPPPPPHMQMTNCSLCHGVTIDPQYQINIVTHVDGILQADFAGNCDACHGAPPDTGAHLVHYGATVADASYGGTGVTSDLLPGGTAYAFDCGNCHPMDPTHHGNGVFNSGGGVAEIELSPAGAPPGSLKELHLPTATYVPGATVLTDATGFTYTEGTCSDVYCHSDKTVTSGVVPAPGADFPFTGYPTVYPPYTVDISRGYQTVDWGDTLSCDGCHGFPPRTYYPDVEAGVGDSHSWIDDYGYDNLHAWNMAGTPVACAGCHYRTVEDQGVRGFDANFFALYEPVPIVGYDQHVDGAPDVGFTPELVLVRNPPGFDLAAATYDPATQTCSAIPCHLQQTEVQWGAPYRWWVTNECDACHQYY